MLSDKPVLNGRTYCSPFCGSGCTKDEHDKAKAIGVMTLKRLKNPAGWKIRVWENMGWHVQLKKGGMNLHIRTYGDKIEYSTLFSAEGGSGGDPSWTDQFRSEDPNKAVEHQLKLVRRELKKIQKSLNPFPEE